MSRQYEMQACPCHSLASLSEGLNYSEKKEKLSPEARAKNLMLAPKTKTCRDVVVKEKKVLSCFLSPLFCFADLCIKKSLNVCNYFFKKTTSTLNPLPLCVEIVFTWIFIGKQNTIVKVKPEVLFLSYYFGCFQYPMQICFIQRFLSIQCKKTKKKLTLN